MKRNMDLIRALLLEIEEKHDGSGRSVKITGTGNSEVEVVEHLFMLTEAEMIESRDASHMQGRGIIVLRMTWKGHEYLDNIRDPEIWEKTKSGAEKIGGFSLDIVSALAKGFIKKKIEQHTGVAISL